MNQASTSVLVQRNIRLFSGYRIASRCYFHLPVLLFYFWQIELGMYRIITLLALYGLTSTFCTRLNQYLLDCYSKKQVVAIGEVAKSAGLVLLLVGSRQSEVNIPLLCLAQITGGAGFSIALSADAGLLRQLTARSPEPQQFLKVQTQTQSWMFIATLLAGTTGSILFDYNSQWPFIATLSITLFALILLLLIDEHKDEPAQTKSKTNSALLILPKQRFWMRYYSLSRAFTLAPFIGFIPFYFIMVNVEPLLFGAVLSFFTLSAWAAAQISNKLLKKYGITTLLTLTFLSTCIAMWMFGFSDVLAEQGIDYFTSGLTGIGLLGLGTGGVRPVTMANMDLAKNSAGEWAIIFSQMERDFGVINGVLLMLGAYILINMGIQTLMISFSVLYIVFIVAQALMLQKNQTFKSAQVINQGKITSHISFTGY